MHLNKNTTIHLLALTWVIFWPTALAALVTYIIGPSGFTVINYQILGLGTLSLTQAAMYIAFVFGGGALTLLSAFCLLVKLGETITQGYEESKVPVSSITLPPAEPWIEPKTYPLELGKTINTITDYIKAHPIKTGAPLVILGPVLLGAFIWNTTRIHPIIRNSDVYQVLFITVPILSIISTLAGITIIIHYLKKRKKKDI